MFFRDFPKMACRLQHLAQSHNNNKRPNKKNDVITDLGGEGDFPMFLYDAPFFPHPWHRPIILRATASVIAPSTLWPLSQ